MRHITAVRLRQGPTGLGGDTQTAHTCYQLCTHRRIRLGLDRLTPAPRALLHQLRHTTTSCVRESPWSMDHVCVRQSEVASFGSGHPSCPHALMPLLRYGSFARGHTVLAARAARAARRPRRSAARPLGGPGARPLGRSALGGSAACRFARHRSRARRLRFPVFSMPPPSLPPPLPGSTAAAASTPAQPRAVSSAVRAPRRACPPVHPLGC